jgi:hypothetical protein
MDLDTPDALIQKRVAEAQASQSATLEPWFQSPAVAAEIRWHEAIFQQRKWSLYYEKHGSIVCGKKERPHCSRGFCNRCQQNVINRLIAIERECAKAHQQEYEARQIENISEGHARWTQRRSDLAPRWDVSRNTITKTNAAVQILSMIHKRGTGGANRLIGPQGGMMRTAIFARVSTANNGQIRKPAEV